MAEPLTVGAAPGRRGPRIARRLLIGVALGAPSLLYLAPEVYGLETTSPFVQLVAFRPYLAAAQLLLALIGVLLRRRWWPTAGLVAGVSVVVLGSVLPRAVPAPPPDGPAAGTLTVLTFNVYQGRADVLALAGAMSAYRPDVVVLPEGNEDFEQSLEPLVRPLGYHVPGRRTRDQQVDDDIAVLVSPRLGRVTATAPRLDTRFQWLQLDGGGLGDVGVVAVHATSPKPSSVPAWAEDLAALRRWCAPGGGPIVVAGDLNATLDHAPLRADSSGCVDAAAATGRGLQPTWPTRWPGWLGVQIDHVFTSGGVAARTVSVLDLPGSDHRALLAELAVPPR
jgi:endonuclease/exonuclease/phosphatase (EEP) superfamily protein YafD